MTELFTSMVCIVDGGPWIARQILHRVDELGDHFERARDKLMAERANPVGCPGIVGLTSDDWGPLERQRILFP